MVAISIAVSAMVGFNSSAPVTANHRLRPKAMRYCSDALKGRDYLFTETAMVRQGAIL